MTRIFAMIMGLGRRLERGLLVIVVIVSDYFGMTYYSRYAKSYLLHNDRIPQDIYYPLVLIGDLFADLFAGLYDVVEGFCWGVMINFSDSSDILKTLVPYWLWSSIVL